MAASSRKHQAFPSVDIETIKEAMKKHICAHTQLVDEQGIKDLASTYSTILIRQMNRYDLQIDRLSLMCEFERAFLQISQKFIADKFTSIDSSVCNEDCEFLD